MAVTFLGKMPGRGKMPTWNVTSSGGCTWMCSRAFFRKSQTVDVFVMLIMLGLVVTVMFVRSSPTEIDVIQ
ncbi:hypothetical protein C5H23_06935 [Xylella fastidiosa]|nr:hypothetical protein XYFPCFBP8417_01595 [Xylella fastidiosa subsp. multiplex]TNV89485.1 hypothetical protein C5H23_06935 [Xylella fastidiosa]TNV98906.1 hypothetical protein C5H21_05715 [Xylella fastidiosa]